MPKKGFNFRAEIDVVGNKFSKFLLDNNLNDRRDRWSYTTDFSSVSSMQKHHDILE